ncbi:MAG: ribonuclease D [Sphingomonadales bacterium]
MKLIKETAALEALCERLKKARYITVDTEFERSSTYFSKLCLIQVADEHGAEAIDTLAPGLDLTSFFELMQEESLLKVFHSAFQDMEIFVHMAGQVPKPVFDTQLAAMVCGYGDSVGYDTLVKVITGRTIDKSMRFTDWTRRPLSDKQVEYALGDVTHLRRVFEHLEAQIAESGRDHWLTEEMQRLTSAGTYLVNPEAAWKRLKVKTGNRRFLGRVQALAAWREERAVTRNMPRGRVVKDQVLMELAAREPADLRQLNAIKGLGGPFRQGNGAAALLEIIRAANNKPENELPEPMQRSRRNEKPGPVLDLLKVLLKYRCKVEGVAPKLVANAEELEHLAIGRDAVLRFMEGWRYEVFGKQAEQLMTGRLGVIADGDSLKFIELDEEARTARPAF